MLVLKRLLPFIIIIAFLPCGLILAQDIDQTQKAIVKIFAGKKEGDGVGCIIKVDKDARKAYLLTAHHVIANAIKNEIEIRVEFYIGAGLSEEVTAEVNNQWIDKDNDFAVIFVENYPEKLELPVIFIDDLQQERTLDPVWTVGYVDKKYKFKDLHDLRAFGRISSRKSKLRYGANIVRDGFSGGPVFNQEGFMIGMNTNLDIPNREIYAVRARVFKSVIDDWIDLPRMQLEVAIDSPIGAKDGIVSTEQEFTIKASVRDNKDGNLIAPKVKLSLNVPEGYQIEGEKTMTVSLQNQESQEGIFRVQAPKEAKGKHHIMVCAPKANPPLKPIRITTVKAAVLRPELIKPKSRGLTLFVGQHLDVQAVVKNSGDAKLKESGTLKIDFQPHEFDLVDGRREEPLVVDQLTNWKLKARSETTAGNIVVKIESPGQDENGMMAEVIDPSDRIFVKVKDISRSGSYIGISALFNQEEDMGEDKREMAIEAEFGLRQRVLNLMGIPVYVVGSATGGIDGVIDGFEGAWTKGTDIYKERHGLLTVSVAVPVGPILLQGGIGHSWYFNYRSLDIDGDRKFNGWHGAGGIALNSPPYAFQIGLRRFNDLWFLSVQFKSW